MRGSTGSSMRMRDERRLLKAEATEYSEKEGWEERESGGKGERDREVERELLPEREGRVAM